MNRLPLPFTRELCFIGGGHAHALVLRKWAMNPLSGARLTLINPGATAPYTGMLPGFVAGHYGREDLSIDLMRLARFAGARLIIGAVDGIDRAAQRIHVPGRTPIAYDLASINIGITSDPPDIPGFARFGIPAKPLGLYAQKWVAFKEQVNTSAQQPRIVTIGGGIGGIELSLAMAHAMPQAQITIVDRGRALSAMGRRARAVLLARLATAGITLVQGASVAEISETHVTLSDGQNIASQFTVGTAGARPFGWLADTGLALNSGFVAVNDQLETSDPNILAAGDCAALPDPRPKAGVFAVRQAPILLHNLQAKLSNAPLRQYKPQTDYLKLISLGEKSALADKWGLALRGSLVWHWKDRIDQKFMQQFRDLPEMNPPKRPDRMALGLPELIDAKPMCGGCAAKVGQSGLSEVLENLPKVNRPDVSLSHGDDAAVLTMGDTTQVITTDTLRAFCDDPFVMARIAANHALGDIWAMGAAPQSALAHVTLPPLAPRLQQAWLAEIMDAASAVIGQSGAAIVGGHSALGAELSIGFTVTGLLSGPAITLSGAKPGDRLILTKPLGSGTIMAAEMQLQARGAIVAGALEAMQMSQAKAAQILAMAHAMTDVTGFGLAGHLNAMAAASGLRAVLDGAQIPYFDGAVELAASGIRATLFEENCRAVPSLSPDTPETTLLFDPQTAGGLLASVATNDAQQVLAALRGAGYDAAVIGEMQRGVPSVVLC